MLERLSPAARAVLEAAEGEARMLDHDTVGSEHLLLALASSDVIGRLDVDRDSLCADLAEAAEHAHGDRALLAAIGIDLDEVRRRAEELYGRRLRRNGYRPRRAASIEQTLAAARREARSAGTRRIGPEHLLLGVFSAAAPGAGVLLAHGLTPGDVRRPPVDLA